jgi:hypothetical protein
VLRELRHAHVSTHLYGKSSDLCSGNFGLPKVRASRQGKGGKAREGRQGKGRAARQGKGGKGRAARQGMGGYIV